MDFYISVCLLAVSALLSSAAGLPIIKILQLSGYKAAGVVAWWKATNRDTLIRYIALCVFSLIALAVYLGCFSAYEYARYCAVALYIILCTVFIITSVRHGGKGVKFTPRVIRLILTDTIIMLVLAAGVAWASYANVYCQSLVAALALFAPFVVLVANAVNYPVERLNNRKFVKRAKAKLSEVKPTVIGITGSYGKTTAKNLLLDMLSEDHSVLATPESYNTPMGVCKTLNDKLTDEKIFIAEMGARYKGDIKELCGIVGPDIGIITAIGDMHLATLKTRANVADTKYELAESLPSDGFLALNGYDEDCRALGERQCSCEKVITGESSRVSYKDLKIDGDGTGFTLVMDGGEYAVTTRLLGAHIAELACVCAAVALRLGVKPETIVKSLAAAQPVAHRLELLSRGAVTVIDDAYNSNPVGAANALDVIKRFDATRIIITPGFVELGAVEKQSNIELGSNIAEACDHAFLVGSRAADIKKGAIDGGMSEEAVRCFPSRDEAVAALDTITGDKVVLFENDLPDNIK